jgi:hypothetical protein
MADVSGPAAPPPPHDGASGEPSSPAAPDGRAVATGAVLLLATLAVIWGWLFLHVGSGLGTTLATICSIVVLPITFLLHSTATDRGRWFFTGALAQSRTHRALGTLLAGFLLLACTVSSVQISASAADSGTGTSLWVGSGADNSRFELTQDEPLRKLGLVFTRVPEVNSSEYRLAAARSLRPFLPRRYRYPYDFEPRLALIVVPDGALFINFIHREYQVRVRDGNGALLVETTLGGRTGMYALSIDGQLSNPAFLARLRADQPERDSAELALRAARWTRSRALRLRRVPRADESLRIEVLHLTREPLLQQSVIVGGPGQIVYLQ